MQKKRFVALTLAFALVLTMFVGLSAEPVSAASATYEVPVKIIYYSNEATDDVESIEKAVWKYAGSDTFTYNTKGYVTAQGSLKTKWTLKGSKRVKAKTGSKKLGSIARSTYKSGKLKSVAFKLYNKKGKSIGKGTEKYSRAKGSKGWISKISGKNGKIKYTVSYTYTFYSNGLPKTIKETSRVRGSKFVTTYGFNSNGFIASVKTKYGTTKYIYKYAGVKPVERYVYDDGFLMSKEVLVYGGKYTRDKKTYIGTINTNSMNDVSSFVRDALPPLYPWLAK